MSLLGVDVAQEWFLGGIAGAVGWLAFEVRRAIRRGERREDMMLKALLGEALKSPSDDEDKP